MSLDMAASGSENGPAISAAVSPSTEDGDRASMGVIVRSAARAIYDAGEIGHPTGDASMQGSVCLFSRLDGISTCGLMRMGFGAAGAVGVRMGMEARDGVTEVDVGGLPC